MCPRIAPCTDPCFWFRLVARSPLDDDDNLEAGEIEDEGYGSVEPEKISGSKQNSAYYQQTNLASYFAERCVQLCMCA